MTMVPRFFNPPPGSFFLFGPRGTGKSTWLRATWPDADFVDLLDPAEHRVMAARPELLEQRVRARPRGTRFVIDEVQKVPSLLDVVHRLIEERLDATFTLTGSSARSLKRAGVDLLAGRAVLRSFHPFMAAELGHRFDLDAALEVGMLPIVIDSASPADVLDAYVGLYVREEVQQEALVRDVGGFSRFLEVASFSHGQALNVAEIARECAVPRTTVAGWLRILEDLLLAFQVPVFTKRARRAVVAAPKLYLFDAGVFRTLRPRGPLDRPDEIAGPALEGLVAQHLRAWLAHRDERATLHYWRTRGGSEVDFVLYGEETFVAIEVKHTTRVRRSDLAALRTFASDYPECRPLLLHRGRHPLLIDGVLCVPCDELLLRLDPRAPLVDILDAWA